MPVGCLQIYQIENDIDIDINVYLPITWERNQTYQLSGSTKKAKTEIPITWYVCKLH